MLRRRRLGQPRRPRRRLVAAMTIVSLSGSAGAAPRAGYLRLAGSAAPFTSHDRVTGAVAGSVRLTIQVWLRPGNLAAAQRYATAVSTPGSTLFHHYLRPDAYTARFGASQAAAGAVESWLRRQGFTGIQADAQRNYVRATGPIAAIDAAFRIQLENYQSSTSVNAGPYQLRANNRPVAIPTSLSRYVLGVTGLDNAAPMLPLMLSPAYRRGTAGSTGPLLAVLRAASRSPGCPSSSGGRRSRPRSAATSRPSCGPPTGPTCATTAGGRRSRWSSRA